MFRSCRTMCFQATASITMHEIEKVEVSLTRCVRAIFFIPTYISYLQFIRFLFNLCSRVSIASRDTSDDTQIESTIWFDQNCE